MLAFFAFVVGTHKESRNKAMHGYVLFEILRRMLNRTYKFLGHEWKAKLVLVIYFAECQCFKSTT